MALHVYGLMRAEDGDRVLRAEDRDGPALATVVHDGVCALVSEVPDEGRVLRRETALAHSQILQTAFECGPVLPVRFGTVIRDPSALERDLLAPRTAELRSRLDALEAVAEMQLKASYREEPLLRSILASQPDLADRATRIRGLPPAATHFDRIALGEAISGAVQARRELDSRRLVDGLSSLAMAVTVSEPHSERAVLNASFLVARERLDEFDAAVEELSEQHAREMQFHLIGPMPVYSFSEPGWEEDRAGAGRSQWG
jgi:hypothetical protein